MWVYNSGMQALPRLFCRALAVLAFLSMAGMARAQAAAVLDEGLALHLLNRLGYGPAPGDPARVRAMGTQAFVESQLAPPPVPPRLQARLDDLARSGAPEGEEALLRAIASGRQLEEVLAAFWIGHVGQVGDTGHALRVAVRPHVLGRYAQLRAVLAQHAQLEGRPPGGGRAALRALVRHFVTAPSPGLQASLWRVWQKSGGEQREVLRVLLTSKEFLAPVQWNSKRKDSFRFVVSAVRASGVIVENVAPLVQYVQGPMDEGGRAVFVERLAGGQLALAMAPPQAHRYASSAPPMRAGVAGGPPQGTVAQPGPVLMEAPTPSAIAMARAARSQPPDPDRLRGLLSSEEFLRY